MDISTPSAKTTSEDNENVDRARKKSLRSIKGPDYMYNICGNTIKGKHMFVLNI